MKKLSLKLLAILLTVAMLCSMLPVFASATDEVKKNDNQEISKKSEAIIEADIWDKIEAFEKDNIIATRDNPVDETDYAELSDEIEALVKQSETFVEGSINRNGDFFTWETSEGIPCCYSPALRYKLSGNSETGNDKTTVENFATKAAPSDKDVFLIAPYYGYDSSFTNQYKNEASSIASATGGKYTLYEGTNATITNIANAFQNGGVVIFDSHGITDYQNGEDYVSRANSSYLCLKSSSGLTSADTQAVSGTYGTYYHAMNGGSGTYCVDGTAIKNHMSKAAPGTILWMAICLGMATSGLCTPMRNAGCEVVYGYSQSVSFTGDYKYETYFWNKMKAGSDVATAVSYMKSAAGSNWDPAYASYSQSQAKAYYVAFPIVVSDQDTYPGQGKVDAVQTVKSTYKLIDSGSSTTPTTAPTTAPDDGGTVDSLTYNLVTSASQLTAGEYIIITVGADGTYYALSATQDGSYNCMQSEAVGLSSVASAVSCDSATAAAFGFNLSGNANGFTLSNGNGSLYAYSGDDGVGLYYGTATTWTGSYNSTSKGFTLKTGSLYMALRDDAGVTGDNGSPIFALTSSTSTGTTLMHMYKRASSATCSHTSTSNQSTPATCTTPGSNSVVCNSCSAVLSTTEIPALGHNIQYTSNNNGTHKMTCSRCSYSSSADCTYTNNVCKYCGYTNNDGGATVDSYKYTLVTSASQLTSGEYIIITVGADGTYYALSATQDGSYKCMQSEAVGLSSVASAISCDSATGTALGFTLSGNANGFTLGNGYGSLYAYSGDDGVGLYYDTASTWTGSYNSSSKGFTLKSGSLYMALRDDAGVTGDNGSPIFALTSSTSTGTTLMHMYKKEGGTAVCTHANTGTSTIPATCTQDGETVVTCKDCGATVSTTAIPALGHDYKYASNNNGTHKITCSRCSYSSSANCSLVNNKCSYCGYTYVAPTEPTEPELPEEPEVPVADLEEGQYVIAAKVNGVYYAMANTFASCLDGGHHDPNHRNQNQNRQNTQHQIDKEFIKAFTLVDFIVCVHTGTSLVFQNFTLGDLVDQSRQCEGEQEDHNTDGHGIAVAAAQIFLVVHIQQRHIGSVVGAAAGHGTDKQEGHIDGGNDEEGQGGADIGPDQRNGDLEELGDPVSTVQTCGLVQRAGNSGHGGHVHDHVVTDGLPDHGNDQTGDDVLLTLPQNAFLTEEIQNGVQQTLVDVVDGGENTGDNDNRQNIGDVEHNPEEILALQLLAGQNAGKDQRGSHGEHGNHHDQQQHILHGANEGSIPQQHLEILQTDEGLLGIKGTPLEQRQTEHVESRCNHKNGKQHHGRYHAQCQECCTLEITSH